MLARHAKIPHASHPSCDARKENNEYARLVN